MIKGILFDLDNTLYDENMYIKNSYRYICKKMKLSQDCYKYMIEEQKREGTKEIFQKTVEKFSLKQEDIQKMVEYYRNAEIKLELYEDTKIILNNSIRKGIITNGGVETQNNKIRILNLKNYFEEILITGKYFKKEEWKPSEKPYQLMLKKMRLKATECLFIGDRYETDIVGAINANIKPILINRTAKVNVKDNGKYYEINSLENVEKIIRKLNK